MQLHGGMVNSYPAKDLWKFASATGQGASHAMGATGPGDRSARLSARVNVRRASPHPPRGPSLLDTESNCRGVKQAVYIGKLLIRAKFTRHVNAAAFKI